MWLRRVFYRWMFPAAVLLPLWLLIGWGVFGAGGWAFLWVLFIAIPSVFFGQIVLALLVRSRPSVREARAVSWFDVAGFAVWHALVVIVGCFVESWFSAALGFAIIAAIGLFWLSIWQLRTELVVLGGGASRSAAFGAGSSGGFGTFGPTDYESADFSAGRSAPSDTSDPSNILIVMDAPPPRDEEPNSH